MNWEVLTVYQVSAMLLEERYRGHWETLRDPLRTCNGSGGLYPLYPITYALTAVAVWRALSEREDPQTIDLAYLEDKYGLRDLLWDSSRPNGQYAYAEYLAKSQPRSGEGNPSERASGILENLKHVYCQKPFEQELTLKELLDQNCREANQNPRFTEKLKALLKEWLQKIPETALPPRTSSDEAAPPPEEDRAGLRRKLDQTFAREVCGLIRNGGIRQFIFTGAPGTGKTYAATLLAEYLGAPLPPPAWAAGRSAEPKAYMLVQFHPSYDYTDFVEGLRPVQMGGQMRYVKLDGSFKAFCRRVVRENGKRPGGRYFFIIDEINRAELSKVFGELMYCLEMDKRGPDHRVQTQYQNLAAYELKPGAGREYGPIEDDVFEEGFYIPENVYIIGTMNDIDRSVEGMDFALRRRFSLLEAVVDEKMLYPAFCAMGFGSAGPDGRENILAARLTRCVMGLNRVLAEEGAVYGLNRQYFISHGQFANLPKTVQKAGPLEEILHHVWTYRLEALLREYLRGVDEDRTGKFLIKCRGAFLSGASEGEKA